MNVYDAANNLARAIQESDEYKKFKVLDKEVHSNPDLKAKIEEFQNKQMELQTMQMMGQELDETKLKEAQDLFQSMSEDPKASAYFECEMRLNQMMGDISKILGDAMDFRSERPEE